MRGRNLLNAAAAALLLAALAPGAARAGGDIDYDARRAPALRRCDDPAHH
jgi:hypothetical protein